MHRSSRCRSCNRCTAPGDADTNFYPKAGAANSCSTHCDGHPTHTNTYIQSPRDRVRLRRMPHRRAQKLVDDPACG